MRSSSPNPAACQDSAPGPDPRWTLALCARHRRRHFVKFEHETSSRISDVSLSVFRRFGRHSEDDLEPAFRGGYRHARFYMQIWRWSTASAPTASMPHSQPLRGRPRREVLGISRRNPALAPALVPWRAPNDAEVGPYRRSVASASDGASSLAREVGGGLRRRPHNRRQNRAQEAVADAIDGRSITGSDGRDLGRVRRGARSRASVR